MQGVQDERRKQWLQAIYESNQRLAGIADDLLNVSRIQSGRILPRNEPCALSEVVEEALAHIQPTTNKHDFMVAIPPNTPPCPW